jgi:hypothetical protein
MGIVRIPNILILIFISILIAAQSFGQIKIGVALPLMKDSPGSPDRATGEQMLKGIKDALTEYEQSNESLKVQIIIEDTGKDPEKTIDALNKFGSDPSVVSVIGPVFSAELVNSAGAADFHKMPVISPTATVNFIAEKNPYVFQLNPTYDIRGRLMAKYASDKLGMKRFIIFSEDSYGKLYADGFANQVKTSSDSILFTKYYQKDQYDLSNEAGEIRKFLEENDRFIDFGTITATDLEKLRKIGLTKEMSDTLIMKRYLVSIYRLPGGITPEVLSSAGVTVSAYNDKSFNIVFGIAEAIYIPIARHDEIAKVALALFKQRINLSVLGTSDWNNEESLQGSKDVLPIVFFEADFFVTKEQKSDVKNMNEQELRNYFFGLGAMQLVLNEISKGNTSRSDLNESLESLKNYEAPYNMITLINRTNHSLRIMKFQKGALEKVGDFVY